MKIRVGILLGGKSAEHEISILSAKNVVAALDKTRFEPVLIYIDKLGRWGYVASVDDMDAPSFEGGVKSPVVLALGDTDIPSVDTSDIRGCVDVVFPVLHGPLGEDGSTQGLLELLNLPYVGPGVLGSAVGMDKEVMKRLLRDAGIATARYEVITASTRAQLNSELIIKNLGLPLFVKPANMGSSVGVSKVMDAAHLEGAVDEALKYDTKALIEEAIDGSEIECAVLGNTQPEASEIGRISPVSDDFYSYDAKYIDAEGAVLEIPARMSAGAKAAAQATALKTVQALCCEGMTRVDMFLRPDDTVYVNEVNTIPGFTKISMYPKLWGASGLGYTDLVSRLIELAFERFEARQSLHTSH